MIEASIGLGLYIHERSGSVAFPRTNVAPANPAEVLGAEARSAERNAVVRSSVELIVAGG